MKNKCLKVFTLLSQIAEITQPVGRVRLVAAIVNSKSEIISLGSASRKTHPIQKKYQKNKECIFLHAETDAIRRALQKGVDLSQCSLYVCRIKFWEINRKLKVLGFGNAKPCEGCQKAIENFEFKNVFYTIDSPHIEWVKVEYN